MPEPKIERYEVITVQTIQKNQYGDLLVNGKLKISNKRNQLFDIFQPGAEVKVGYASYMNTEYIASAEQTGIHTISKTVEESAKSKPEPKTDWAERDRITRKSIERQTSLNAAIELAKVDKIKPEQILPVAARFESYLENGEVKQNTLVEEAKKLGAVEIDPSKRKEMKN